ncbi:MAG: type II secretion system protein [Gammaproteobacteria bacterium]|nr:type II secretion system protein [Gammaproteobacteria bacterium]
MRPKAGYAQRGMTLIELLIVLTIAGLLASLVAPYGGRALDSARAQEEWMTMTRMIRGISFRAYSEGADYQVHVRGTEMAWSRGKEQVGTRSFEFLFFEPEQRVIINRNGIADRTELSVLHRGRARKVALNSGLTGEVVQR